MSGVKKKRVNLSIKQKLELISKLEDGTSVAHVCEVYGVKTVSYTHLDVYKRQYVY